MTEAIIFLNGNAPEESELRKIGTNVAGKLIICADGAYRYLDGKIKPDIVIGDFDSIDEKFINKDCEIVKLSPEKDYTDGHVCMDCALNSGAKVIYIYGAFGGRPDHAYSNLSLLYQAKRRGAVAMLIGEGFTVTLESGKIVKSVVPGATVSLVPFLESAHILSTEGLKYPMKNVTLGRLHILGISNTAEMPVIKVEAEGELLVFIENVKEEKDDENHLRQGPAISSRNS